MIRLGHQTKEIEHGWKYIGKGVIYSINGVRQAMEETKYFFVKDKA